MVHIFVLFSLHSVFTCDVVMPDQIKLAVWCSQSCLVLVVSASELIESPTEIYWVSVLCRPFELLEPFRMHEFPEGSLRLRPFECAQS